MIPTPSEPEPLKGHQYSSSLTIIRIEHCGSPAAKCKRIILLGIDRLGWLPISSGDGTGPLL
jgi:hypothetical protein